jgi:hypothetical protein
MSGHTHGACSQLRTVAHSTRTHAPIERSRQSERPAEGGGTFSGGVARRSDAGVGFDQPVVLRHADAVDSRGVHAARVSERRVGRDHRNALGDGERVDQCLDALLVREGRVAVGKLRARRGLATLVRRDAGH